MCETWRHVGRGARSGCWAVLAVALVSLVTAAPSLADEGDPAAPPAAPPVTKAESLFREGRELLAQERFAAAAAKFQESLRLERAPGTLFNLAMCHARAGQPDLAWQEYRTGLKLVPQADSPMAVHARRELAALEQQLYFVTLVVPAPRVEGLTLLLDGRRVDDSEASMPLRPGPHVLVVRAPGHLPQELTIVAVAGDRDDLRVPRLAPIEAPPPVAGTRAPVATVAGGDEPAPVVRLGGFARVEVEGQGRGAMTTVGGGVALGPYVELAVGALLGPTNGVYAGGTLFLASGAWRPLVSLGAPVFIEDGAWAGVEGAAGLEWAVTSYFAVAAQVGVAYFPDVPGGMERTVFLPALGVAVRP